MNLAWGTAAAGVVLGMVGILLQPHAFPHAWLSVVVLAYAWPIGSLVLLFAHALTGGRWGEAVRPGLLAGISTLWLLPVLVVPTVFTLPALYPWARPEGAALPNHAWLDVPFFAVRGVIYLACWLGIGALVLRGRELAALAPFVLAALALTWTFGSIDLILSLDPHFTSSIFGMLSLAGAGVLALALAVLISPDAPKQGADLGKLLLGLAVLWAYLDFMQLLIVYQSDLVDQVPWYKARLFGGPGVVYGVITLTHTIIPFFALLSASRRRSAAWLRAVAALMVFSEVLRTWWLVLPESGRSFGLLDVGCMLLGAGLLAALALRHQGREALAHA